MREQLGFLPNINISKDDPKGNTNHKNHSILKLQNSESIVDSKSKSQLNSNQANSKDIDRNRNTKEKNLNSETIEDSSNKSEENNEMESDKIIMGKLNISKLIEQIRKETIESHQFFSNKNKKQTDLNFSRIPQVSLNLTNIIPKKKNKNISIQNSLIKYGNMNFQSLVSNINIINEESFILRKLKKKSKIKAILKKTYDNFSKFNDLDRIII